MKRGLKIVLFGYMGSGKSSIGSALATKLHYTFKDLDVEIENGEGCAIPELFQVKGEIYFRKMESEALKRLINSEEKIVIATGGGTPCYGDTLPFLKEQEYMISIYLKTSLETLTNRLLKEKEKRPLLEHLETKELLNDFIRKHLFERSHFYNQANLTIDTDDRSISEIVENIIVRLF